MTITIIMLYPLLLHSYYSIFPQSDVWIYSVWKHILVDNLHSFGSIPLWNPYLFGGTPFIGNSQVGFFYPINILYFIFPIDITFNFIFILDFFLLGTFTFLYARIIGLSKTASIVSGICMIFNGAIMKQLFLGHIVILDSLIWFPLFLYFFEKTIKSKSLKYTVILGIILGLMILAGNVQIPIYALIAGLIYFYVRLFQERKYISGKIIKFIFVPLIIIVIGLGLSSIQLIPTLEFSKLSIRSEGISYKFASDFSFNPKQLAVIIFPSLFGSDINNSYWGIGSFWSASIYAGILPFFLALIGLIYKRNKYSYSLLVILLFSLIYSFGRYGIIFKFFYDFIPFFNNFRVPTRFLFIYAFSIAIFAGLGFELLSEKMKNLKDKFFSRIIKSFFLIFIFSSFLFVVGYLNKNNISPFEKLILKNSYAQGINHEFLYLSILNDLLTFCLFIFIILISFVLLKLNIVKIRYFYIIVIFIISLDYFQFYTKFYPQNFSKKYYQYQSEVNFLKKDNSKFRIFSIPNLDPVIMNKNNIEILTGYDPLYLSLYRDFLWNVGPHENTPYESFIIINDIKNINNLKLLNVKYVLSEKTIENTNLSKVFKGKLNIYQITNILPRAYVNYSNTSSFVLNSDFKVNEAKIVHYEPNKIIIDANLVRNGYLILSEQFYPGWSAFDNEKQIPIVKSNDVFRSVYLNKGHHKIVFKYDPISYKIGKIISLITILLLFITGLYFKLKKHDKK